MKSSPNKKRQSSLERDLKYISTHSPNRQELNGINVRKLLSLGLIRKISRSTTNYKIPEDAPRWATKYKFTRKKYKVTENSSVSDNYMITDKGKRRLRNLILKRLKPEEDDEDDTKINYDAD